MVARNYSERKKGHSTKKLCRKTRPRNKERGVLDDFVLRYKRDGLLSS
jgi:hypothetical protein